MYVTEYTGMRVRKLIAPATEAVIMSSPTCDSTWHRVVVSIDGAGSGQMYTDGTQVASVVGSASGFGYFVNTANEQNVQLRIGGGGAGGAPSLVIQTGSVPPPAPAGQAAGGRPASPRTPTAAAILAL